MARRAAPNEDRTQVRLTWVFSGSDLATVASVQPGRYRRYLLKVLFSLILHYLGNIESVQACARFRGVCTPLALQVYLVVFGGSVVMYPPDSACIRFVCMYFVTIGEYSRSSGRCFLRLPSRSRKKPPFSRSVFCGRRGSGLI